MIDLVAASPSFASSAAAPASRLPWSSSSPPSPIELWHVARGAAAARTAAAAAAAPAASEEEAEDEEEEVFGPSRSCSVSLRDGPGEETGWRGSLSHENEGEVGGRGEGDDKEEDGRRVCSSPEDDDDDPWQPPQRNRRSSLGRSYRSSSPSISLDEGETCRDVRPLEDLIGSMLAMTVRSGKRKNRVKGKFLYAKSGLTLRVFFRLIKLFIFPSHLHDHKKRASASRLFTKTKTKRIPCCSSSSEKTKQSGHREREATGSGSSASAPAAASRGSLGGGLKRVRLPLPLPPLPLPPLPLPPLPMPPLPLPLLPLPLPLPTTTKERAPQSSPRGTPTRQQQQLQHPERAGTTESTDAEKLPMEKKERRRRCGSRGVRTACRCAAGGGEAGPRPSTATRPAQTSS